jgi:hypothetical protein
MPVPAIRFDATRARRTPHRSSHRGRWHARIKIG